MTRRLELGLLLAILLIAGALRSHRLGAESFWNDELVALANSAGRPLYEWIPPVGVVVDPPSSLTRLENAPPRRTTWTILHEDTHPPLHFMVLRFWREAFGDSEAAARSLSVLAALAALLALYDTMRTLHGPSPALWACLLMALAAPQIRYSQEARNYTLLMAFALGASAALMRVERQGPNLRRSVALGACSLGCVLTHYHGLAVLVSLGLHALIRLRGVQRRRSVLVLSLAGSVFATAWGPVIWSQAQNALARRDKREALQSRSDHWLWEPGRGHGQRTLARAAGLPLLHLSSDQRRVHRPPVWPGVAYVLAWIVALRRRELLVWCLWLTVPVAALAASDLAGSLAQLARVRYSLVASPAVFALLGAAVAQAPRLLRHGVPAVAALSCVLAIPGAYRQYKEPWRDMGAALQLVARPGEALILDAHDPFFALPCRALLHYGGAHARPLLLAGDRLAPSARRRLQQAGTAWLVAPESFDLKSRLPGAVAAGTSGWPGIPRLTRLRFPAASPLDPEAPAG